MKTFMAFVFAFLLSFVASAAEAGVSINFSAGTNCVTVSDSSGRVDRVRFRIEGKKWSSDRKPSDCWTLPETGKVQATVFAGRKCFKNKAGKCAKFSKHLTKPTPAPKVETVDQILARAQRDLVGCKADLASCQLKPAKAKAKRGKAWWEKEENCSSAFAKKKGLTRWNSVGKHCACETGFGWVGSKKAGKCGRGGLPLVPGKVPTGVAAKSLTDLFGRVETLEKDMVMVKADVAVLKKDMTEAKDFLLLHDVEIKKVQITVAGHGDRLDKLEKAVAKKSSGFGVDANIYPLVQGFFGPAGNFHLESVLVGPRFKLTDEVQLRLAVGVGTDFKSNPSFITEGAVRVFPTAGMFGFEIVYGYTAYAVSSKTYAAMNGQSHILSARAIVRVSSSTELFLGAGGGIRTMDHGNGYTGGFVLSGGVSFNLPW